MGISDVVIIGSGVAGVSAAQSLRSEGYEGRLLLVGKENVLPYDRTSLSKAVLGGDLADPPPLLPAGWYEDEQIETLFGRRATRIDLTSREVLLDDGKSLKADRVLIATGSSPRVPSFPGTDILGVETLRTLEDVQRLRQDWEPGKRLVIMGGGLIGCEVATTARKLGLEVTVLQASDELLERVMGRRIGSWCRARLQEIGVTVALRTGVAGFEGKDRLNAVIGTDGRRFPADSALICIGAEPDVQIARQAGLACDRGISVNDSGETASAGVFAAGDVASWPLLAGGQRSLETYINSQKQATAVASAMLGNIVHAPQIPVSWSEIAGHRMQMIGDIAGTGEYVTRGSLEDGAGQLFRLSGQRVVAAISANAPRDFAMAVRLVESGVELSPGQLGDMNVTLRQLARPAQQPVRVA
ncbi:NAD(P)/FAD-dependent oxidoreductase [Rhodococcus sp. UFZ-B548]|uniref:NAD(P)/FAD-dependent oxidoreductase n=1 Tax=Rhodococcus sp. UFZ-B548 TaxID=2742212 RepID=UPI0015F776BB|nr:FAD-dependent oxidoreductase [Rhodococcus sp. UFZ-B548]